MSYILDALKKSDQERQQGTSPHLHSIHGHPPTFKGSGPYKQRRTFWLIAVGLLLMSLCAGILFSWYQSDPGGENPSTATTDPPTASEQRTAPLPSFTEPLDNSTASEEDSSSFVVIARDKEKILLAVTLVDTVTENPMDAGEQESLESLPFLKDLPYALQTEIPKLTFAGHTYSKDPSQRMIIINNNILREGDKIDPNTRLKTITWDGVIVEYKTNIFRVNTN